MCDIIKKTHGKMCGSRLNHSARMASVGLEWAAWQFYYRKK